MGLDVSIKSQEPIICPHCKEVALYKLDEIIYENGREWYNFLEKIGYYVSYKNRTQRNDWYGKDMVLSDEQIHKLKNFVELNNVYYKDKIYFLVLKAIDKKYRVVINAEW